MRMQMTVAVTASTKECRKAGKYCPILLKLDSVTPPSLAVKAYTTIKSSGAMTKTAIQTT